MTDVLDKQDGSGLTANGRRLLASNFDHRIHLLGDDFQHSLCGAAYIQLRIATPRELELRDFCQVCVRHHKDASAV